MLIRQASCVVVSIKAMNVSQCRHRYDQCLADGLYSKKLTVCFVMQSLANLLSTFFEFLATFFERMATFCLYTAAFHSLTTLFYFLLAALELIFHAFPEVFVLAFSLGFCLVGMTNDANSALFEVDWMIALVLSRVILLEIAEVLPLRKMCPQIFDYRACQAD